MRRFLSALALAAIALIAVSDGSAVAQSCRALQAELDYLRESGGGRGDRSRYERAFREQANVLARTEARARNAGCFGGFLFFRDSDRACRTLVPKLRQMRANLDRLDRLRRQGGSGSSQRIRLVQRAMAARGCGLPGEGEWREAAEVPSEPDTDLSGRGTYRTLCVRTCDGYYFPISFSTTQQQFGSDAQTCAQMCPGTEARLFVHRNPGGGPADMVSLEGQTYTSLPNAFKYRTSLDAACTCKPAGGYALSPLDPGSRPSVETHAAAPLAPAPRPRPAPGEDPETLADRLGGFSPGASDGRTPATVAATTPDGRPVRVVGPNYWSAPEQDGVILTPVPN